jgi:hypothetical protein
MPTNSFSNRHSGEQLWGVADITLVAGIGNSTWARVDGLDTVVFTSAQTGIAVDPNVVIPQVVSNPPVGNLTISATSTGATITSSNASDTTHLLVYAMRDLGRSGRS